MRALSERQRRAFVAGQVETVWIREALGVVVTRPEQQQDILTPADRPTVQLDVLERTTPGELHRAVVARKLAQRARHKTRIGAQPRELLGVPEQCIKTIAKQVARRFVAAEE